MRKIFEREAPVEHQGREMSLPYTGEGATGFGKPLRSILHTNPALPIWLGSGSEATVKLTAELCDGWLPMHFVPGRMDHYRPWVEEGFRRAGGDKGWETFEIQAGAAVDPHRRQRRRRQAALQRQKMGIALYVGGMGHSTMNFHNQHMVEQGYGDAAARIQELFLEGRKDEAAAAVPDDYVDERALVGPPARIKDALPRLGRQRHHRPHHQHPCAGRARADGRSRQGLGAALSGPSMAPALTGRILNPRSDGVHLRAGRGPDRAARAGGAGGRHARFIVTTAVGGARRVGRRRGRLVGRAPPGLRRIREHTPAPVVIAATEAARAAGADCLVSLGGSSVVDLTKGVALLLGEGGEPGRPPDPAGRCRGPTCARRRCRTSPCRPRCRAPSSRRWPASPIPTWARSRCTSTPSSSRAGWCSTACSPRAARPRLWAGTGMKVVADTIEVLCARRANPQTDALALGALQLLVDNLARPPPPPTTTSPAAAASSPWPWCSRSSPRWASAWSPPCATSSAAASASPTARRPPSSSPRDALQPARRRRAIRAGGGGPRARLSRGAHRPARGAHRRARPPHPV